MASVRTRQHDVNQPARPPRSAAGNAFTDLVLEVAWLGGIFTAKGEALAKGAHQTLARWVILDAIEDAPATVASIARRRGIARQAVQRVADLLERDGLAVFEANPEHRRSKLLRPTPEGRQTLRTISIAQKAWADALGAQVGEVKLRRATALIKDVRHAVTTAPDVPDRESGSRASSRSD